MVGHKIIVKFHRSHSLGFLSSSKRLAVSSFWPSRFGISILDRLTMQKPQKKIAPKEKNTGLALWHLPALKPRIISIKMLRHSGFVFGFKKATLISVVFFIATKGYFP